MKHEGSVFDDTQDHVGGAHLVAVQEAVELLNVHLHLRRLVLVSPRRTAALCTCVWP